VHAESLICKGCIGYVVENVMRGMGMSMGIDIAGITRKRYRAAVDLET
jgi:hypothetical protein